MKSEHIKPNELCIRSSALKDLVEYAANSVVSREIIKSQGGTVTAFAFDQGQGLSEHTAPFDAFVYNIEGEGEITISGTKHTLSAGEMIIMPARQPHALRATSKFKMLLVMIRT
ncbi:MAG: cupin domain-containing protein [candidate division WOR-3 bacterium]|nr:MAG: cupin domain-containing protein [candidate division WOR-3 bacterium]